MTYEVVSVLKLMCDGPTCEGTSGVASSLTLDVDDVVDSATFKEVVRRAVEQLPQTDWFMLLDFNAMSRRRVMFYCSEPCLESGSKVAPS